MAKKKLTKVERAERDARHERVLANAQRTRELAERAQAKLEAQSSRLGGLRDSRTSSDVRAAPGPVFGNAAR